MALQGAKNIYPLLCLLELLKKERLFIGIYRMLPWRSFTVIEPFHCTKRFFKI